MSNITNREPIELVEFVLPRCVNTYGSAPCTASGSGDAKCYNTRGTCQDAANYRDTPDRHLEADQSLITGEVPTPTRTADLFAGFEVRFGVTPTGTIWQQGGTTDSAWLGITGGNLVFRAGDDTISSGAALGRIAVDATQFAGQSKTLYVEIDFTASGTTTINLWSFCPVELTNTLLGTDTFTASTEWADSVAGTIGSSSATPTGEDGGDWNGGITVARFYDSTAVPTLMIAEYSQSLWLGRGDIGEPIEQKYILPCLTDLGTIGTRLNLSAADDTYEPLGRRGSFHSCASSSQRALRARTVGGATST